MLLKVTPETADVHTYRFVDQIFKELRFRKSEFMNLTEENSFCQIGFFSKLKKDQEGAAGKATLS